MSSEEVDIDNIVADEITADDIDDVLETAIETDLFVENWQAPSLINEEIIQLEHQIISEYHDYSQWQVPGLTGNIQVKNASLSEVDIDDNDKLFWPAIDSHSKAQAQAEITTEIDETDEQSHECVEIEDVTVTAEDLEELQKKAHEEGFALGKSEGFESGKSEGEKKGYQEAYEKAQGEINQKEKELDEIQQQFIDIIYSLTKPFEKIGDNLNEKLLHFIVQLSELIAREQCKISVQGLNNIINEALSKLIIDRKITIYLNPLDIESVNKINNELSNETIKLIADESVSVGGCIIDSGDSHIDMTIENRVKDIVNQIFSENKKELFHENSNKKNIINNIDEEIDEENKIETESSDPVDEKKME